MFLDIQLNRRGKEQEMLEDGNAGTEQIQVFNASKATSIYWPKKKTPWIISAKTFFPNS